MIQDQQEKFGKLQKKLGISFKDINLLINAFVHRSYLNENSALNLPSNERLEFLGDACLELIVSEHLFYAYPNNPEGDLTNYRSAVVNTAALAKTAQKLKLGEYLLLSKGEEISGGRASQYLLANTFEALLGAIYLDQGFTKTQNFLKTHLIPKIDPIVKSRSYKDSKSKLQEISQKEISLTPHYQVLEEWGPDHDKLFKVGVFVGNRKIGEGKGASKQRAELSAAQNALENWNIK